MPVALEPLLVFTVASLLLAVTPGPTMLLALSNGMTGGLRTAAAGILGASLGAAILIAAAAFGLGSLLRASETLFEALRWAGVLYLAWLGVKLWREPGATGPLPIDPASAPRRTPHEAFVRSLLVALSNPKTLLFFAAFLPQFVAVDTPQGPQYLVLGGWFIGLDSMVMLAYAAAGRGAARWLSSTGTRLLQRGCAVGMWVLAILLVLWRKAAR